MGLTDPRTGRSPWAVVQLRQENARAGSWNLVGFQNHMRFGDQARVLRMIPGLQNAEFLRYGQVHRNTYINAPALLDATLRLRAHPNIFFAGQISGVEGYVESISTGLIAGLSAASPKFLGPFRAKPHSARSAPMFPEPTHRIINPQILLSICCRNSSIRRKIESSAKPKSAARARAALDEHLLAYV